MHEQIVISDMGENNWDIQKIIYRVQGAEKPPGGASYLLDPVLHLLL